MTNLDRQIIWLKYQKKNNFCLSPLLVGYDKPKHFYEHSDLYLLKGLLPYWSDLVSIKTLTINL
jgi:hypothetical protein